MISMRPLEPWIKKGARISKAGAAGTIITFHVSTVGNQQYVHSLIAKLDEAPQAYPYNANDLDQLKNSIA